MFLPLLYSLARSADAADIEIISKGSDITVKITKASECITISIAEGVSLLTSDGIQTIESPMERYVGDPIYGNVKSATRDVRWFFPAHVILNLTTKKETLTFPSSKLNLEKGTPIVVTPNNEVYLENHITFIGDPTKEYFDIRETSNLKFENAPYQVQTRKFRLEKKIRVTLLHDLLLFKTAEACLNTKSSKGLHRKIVQMYKTAQKKCVGIDMLTFDELIHEEEVSFNTIDKSYGKVIYEKILHDEKTEDKGIAAFFYLDPALVDSLEAAKKGERPMLSLKSEKHRVLDGVNIVGTFKERKQWILQDYELKAEIIDDDVSKPDESTSPAAPSPDSESASPPQLTAEEEELLEATLKSKGRSRAKLQKILSKSPQFPEVVKARVEKMEKEKPAGISGIFCQNLRKLKTRSQKQLILMKRKFKKRSKDFLTQKMM